MKYKWLSTFLALVFTGVIAVSGAYAQAQPSENAATQSERGATEVPLQNPDEPILDEVQDAAPLEQVPQVDTTRDAETVTLGADDAGKIIGAPVPWQMNFGPAASPSKEKMNNFHDFLLVIITVITLFVMFLLVYVMIRFRRKRNPVPATFTHNMKLEVIWTLVPVLIVLAIVVPSMRLLYFTDKVVDAEMTIVATGYQWYWGYEYTDNDNIAFLSYMIPDEDIKPGQKRLLETDNRVVLPVDTNIRILVTAQDVIHSFAVPSLGLKTDAVPGHTNETWVRIDHEGVYYGQCSEICGVNHAFMPITIEAVSKEEFQQWLVTAKEEFADSGIYNQYASLGE